MDRRMKASNAVVAVVDMYSSEVAGLLEENERLRAAVAKLSTPFVGARALVAADKLRAAANYVTTAAHAQRGAVREVALTTLREAIAKYDEARVEASDEKRQGP